MNTLKFLFLTIACCALLNNCTNSKEAPTTAKTQPEPTKIAASKIPIILDTDANNELDDQHAMAYLFFNGDVFDVKGVTVNNTKYGGGIQGHYDEAERVAKLCNVEVDIYKGATNTFPEIRKEDYGGDFDGAEAVNFIIKEAKAHQGGKLLLMPVGKLTNIALALEKAPEIIPKVKVVWLGSNYPEPGEYNQDNDTASMTYVLETDVEFEIVTVRYGKPSGSDAVRITPDQVKENMMGKGPEISDAVEGRHGGTFTRFGDYAYDLFQHIDLHGNPPARALFDMVAVAIVKNPAWGQTTTIPAPKLVDNQWVDQPENPRTIVLWENFNSDAVINDFYDRMENYVLIK